jgi:hypothetical protein
MRLPGTENPQSRTADPIMQIIKRRREEFFESQIVGTAEDPLVWSHAGLNRAISDEYDNLLREIEGGTA